MLLISRRSFIIMIAAIDAPQRAARRDVDDLSSDAGNRANSAGAELVADSRDAAVRYPDETNTGVDDKTGLKPSGSITTSRDEQVIRGLDISGPVTISHNAVTLENCRISAASFAVVNVVNEVRVPPIIQDCEIDGLGLKGAEGSNVINGYGAVRRCNIHGVENGINVTAPLIFEDNYVHDLAA